VQAILRQKEEKAIQLHKLNGYNHELEMARQEQYELLLSSTDKDIQRCAAHRMASLISFRDLSFVADYERTLGLRNVS